MEMVYVENWDLRGLGSKNKLQEQVSIASPSFHTNITRSSCGWQTKEEKARAGLWCGLHDMLAPARVPHDSLA